MAEAQESVPLGSDRALQLIGTIDGAVRALDDDLARLHRLATLGTMAAGIAHEINNLLTPVLGYAQLAQSHPDDDALRAKALERAVGGVEAAARIAEAMLGFASPTQGRCGADLLDTVNAAIACIGRPPDRDGIGLTIDVKHGLMVAMSPVALQQVVLNLVINAIKVLRRGGGVIRISAEAHPANTEMIQVQVSDSGPGIPAELTSSLFEPFATGSSTAADRGIEPSGHGLGLAICKGLIEQAGGTIELGAQAGGPTAAPTAAPEPTSAADHANQASRAREARSAASGAPGAPTGATFILRLPRAPDKATCSDDRVSSQQKAA